MTIRHFQLPQVSDVAISTAGVASIPNIPQGEIYKSLIIKLTSGIVAADIEYVRIRLGGNLIWDVTGSELDTINQWSGLVNSATYLPIHFGDRMAITPEGQRFGEIDTKNFSYSGFSLDIKLDGTQTAKIQDVIAVVDDRNKPKDGNGIDTGPMIRAMMRADHTFGGAGTVDIDVPLGSDVGNIIRAIHHFDSGSILTDFGLRKDRSEIQELRPIAEQEFYQAEVLRSNQANHYAFDPAPNGVQVNGIDTRRYENGKPVGRASMRIINKVSGSGSIGYVSDLYGTVLSL